MDNITHSLIGAHMARAGLSQKYGKGTTLFMIVMSNITDLDIFWSLITGDSLAFTERRTLTHSILGAPILALAGAWLFNLKWTHIGFKPLFFMGLGAIGAHVLYDLANSYGVVVLYPFLNTRFELAWMFIIDLVVWAILIIPFFFVYPTRTIIKPSLWSQMALITLAIYTGLLGVGRALSSYWIKTLANPDLLPKFSYVFPEALGPHRFRGVLREEQTYLVYQIKWLTGEMVLHKQHLTDDDDPAIQTLRATVPEAKRLDWFFKAPVWTWVPDAGPGIVQAYDLRFTSTTLPWDRLPFSFYFQKNEDGSWKFLGQQPTETLKP